MKKPDVLYLEAADSSEEGAVFVKTEDGGLAVSVEEEKAVDSYNSMFTCNAHLSREQALKLLAWLKDRFV